MALLEDQQKGLLWGIALGIGATFVLRELLPPFGKALRPLAKAGIKSGMIALERGREAAARLGESVEDLVAEVAAEREIESLQRSVAVGRRTSGNGEGARPGQGGEEG